MSMIVYGDGVTGMGGTSKSSSPARDCICLKCTNFKPKHVDKKKRKGKS